MRRLAVLLLGGLGVGSVARAQGEDVAVRLAPPAGVRAFDTPSDAGGSLTVTWQHAADLPEGAVYRVQVAQAAEGPFQTAAEVDPAGARQSAAPEIFGRSPETHGAHFVHVRSWTPPGEEAAEPLENGRPYHLRVEVQLGGTSLAGSGVVEARARANWFNWTKVNNLVLAVLLCGIILGAIGLVRRGETSIKQLVARHGVAAALGQRQKHRALFIRRIAGLEALDEALGRATEMGRSVLFVHGLRDMSQISTIAAVSILGRVAQRTAAYGTELRVTTYDPLVMLVSQETVKESYVATGRPDAYNPDNVFIAGTDQFSYAAAVEGIMVRERPAAHIMMGFFYAESLLLSETGASTGAIQIAGTDAFTQLPFFVTTCDYTLLGEELYAASAYLSREPRLLGSLKGQDAGKAILVLVLVLGTLLATAGLPQMAHLFHAG
ncbi:MAG: DUF6754 domain-containing protein [Candidatus Latescibacterota bacterium]